MTILNEMDNWLTSVLGPMSNSPRSWVRYFGKGSGGVWLSGHRRLFPRVNWVELPDGMPLLDCKFAVVRGLNKLLRDDNLGGFQFDLSLTENSVQLWCDSGVMILGGAAEESVSTFIDRMRVREAKTGQTAAHPGGVAAWSTGQSAVSAGGSLGPSVLACDHLDNKELPFFHRPSEQGPGIAATIRKDHVKILRREMDRKLVVMSGLDDTWSGEKL